MPRWGQLGCQGFIILDSLGKVVCKTTPAFMQVEGLAFRYVEAVLSAMLEARPIPEVAPGVTCRIKDLVSEPELNGKLAMCTEAENGEGQCTIVLQNRRNLKIKATNLSVAPGQPQPEKQTGGCCAKDSCAEESCAKESCVKSAKKAGTKLYQIKNRVEASANKLSEVTLAVREGADLPTDMLREKIVQMSAAKEELHAALTVAKQRLPADDEFLGKFLGIKGPCTNKLCLCAVCECGPTCQCNVADMSKVETCEPCTEFRSAAKNGKSSSGYPNQPQQQQ